MAHEILTITLNPALDLSAETARVEPGPKLRCRAPHFDPGGGGVNVSRVIAELGGSSTAWMALGGGLGELYEELLDVEGIACAVLSAPGQTRLSINVTETDSGEQYRFVLPGPEFDATAADAALDSIGSALAGIDIAVLSGSMPPGLQADFMQRLAHRVREAGARLILDSSGAPLQAALREGVFLVKPNLKEARELAGRDLPDRAAQLAFASDLVEREATRAVVLSLGGEGALVVGEGVRLHLQAPQVEVRSAVGAGDSTVGALALGLARGESLEVAARRAVAAGAAAVHTAATALCRRADVEALIEQVEVERLE